MLAKLENYLQRLAPEGIALAYSGGIDSTLLLAVLSRMYHRKAFPFRALTMQTALQSPTEINDSKKLASDLKMKQQIFTFNPFSLEPVRYNRPDRCYYCKAVVFAQFADYAAANGLKYLLDGTNADDLQVYRPGRKALTEQGVISPLAELGLSKQNIRELSAELGLSTASKPAAPCLATRFEYDTLLDEKMLDRAARGERAIKEMFPDITDVRLRVHNKLARLEVPVSQLQQITAQHEHISVVLKKLGFEYVTLDLEGFRSGCFDLRLKEKQ